MEEVRRYLKTRNKRGRHSYPRAKAA
jgi:hypothetical protein